MNTVAKHTPGPWEITSISQNTGDIGIGHRDLRIVIAEVTNAASFGDMLSGAMARGGGELRQDDCSTQFANARLIAAAPDMLEVLYDATINNKVVEDADWWKRVYAAIAKAEGRSP